jgi:hypothetical protein
LIGRGGERRRLVLVYPPPRRRFIHRRRRYYLRRLLCWLRRNTVVSNPFPVVKLQAQMRPRHINQRSTNSAAKGVLLHVHLYGHLLDYLIERLF